MEVIRIDEIKKQNCKKFDEGSEAEIYKIDDNTVFKELNQLFPNDLVKQNEVLKNKYKKLLLLSELKIPGLVLPKCLVINKEDNFCGYTMKYIQPSKFVNGFLSFFSLNCSLAEKQQYLKKVENIFRAIDKFNKSSENSKLTIWDFNYRNFLVDKNDEVCIADLDNSEIGQYKVDFLSSLQMFYYNNISLSDKMNSSKYLCGLLALSIFVENYWMFDGRVSLLTKEHLSKILISLVLPKDVKDYLQYFFLDDGYKQEYLCNFLDSVVLNQGRVLKCY